jgi:hypothetical protein
MSPLLFFRLLFYHDYHLDWITFLVITKLGLIRFVLIIK